MPRGPGGIGGPAPRPPREKPVLVLSQQQQGRRRLAVLAIFAVLGILAVALTSGGGDGDDDQAASNGKATTTTAGAGGAVSGASTTTRPSSNRMIPGASVVTIKGLGPVVAGMTVEEAAKAAGVPLVAVGKADPDSDCRFVRPKTGPEGLAFMVTRHNGIETIARVDVEDTSFKTRSGIGVGDTEEKVQATYPGRIEVQPHEYVEDGHYLVYRTQSEADSAFSLIFETDGKKVTSFRSGRKPEVTYIEGCS